MMILFNGKELPGRHRDRPTEVRQAKNNYHCRLPAYKRCRAVPVCLQNDMYAYFTIPQNSLSLVKYGGALVTGLRAAQGTVFCICLCHVLEESSIRSGRSVSVSSSYDCRP